MLVDFVNAGVGWTTLDDLGTEGGDEAAIAGTTSGREFGGDARLVGNGLLHSNHQLAGGGQKGLAAQRPLQFVFEFMAVKHGVHALFQAFGGRFGAEAEVEVDNDIARNDVACTRTTVDVAHLPAGGLEEGVARVPAHGGKFCQRGHCLVNGVACQMGVGDVALDAAHGELAAERAATSVLDHVPRFAHGSGFAHDAVVQLLTLGTQLLDDHLGAVDRWAFLVAGEKEGDVQ